MSKQTKDTHQLENAEGGINQHSKGKSLNERYSPTRWHRGRDKLERQKKASDLEQGNTHPLESAEVRTSQDRKSEQASNRHSPTGECRRDKSGHQKKASENHSQTGGCRWRDK